MTSSLHNTPTSYYEYIINTYGLDWTILFSTLEDFANIKSPFSDDQKYLLTIFGFGEAFLDLDYLRDAIKFELRKGKALFQVDESLAFLRLNILVTMFDRQMDKAPDTDEDFRKYCLSHPFWPRIEKQAQVTLELFKKNKSRRHLGQT